MPDSPSQLILEGRANILPDSRTRTIATPKGAVNRGVMGFIQPIFCASCGADGGTVMEENCDFAFWLCTPCFEKYGELTNLYVMPDEVFFERVKQAQLEKYGRVLTADETRASLADPESLESRLARDRANLTPHGGL